MAKCDLSIELDDGDRVYTGGEKIGGVVRVRADKDVKCSGLQVRTHWATHGRGNVDSNDVESTIVFSGEWVAGEQQEYRFELTVGDWPPTYHGHYLNVDHYVEARAKIPWGFDPKASVPFRVRPTKGAHESSAGAVSTRLGSAAAVIVVIFIASVFGAIGLAAAANVGWLMIPFALVPLTGAAVFILFRFVLPKWALGDVVCEVETDVISPGQEVSGELTIQPKKSVSINQITLKLSAQERCVSGSGSNRKTHTHQIFDQTYKVADATTLRPHEKRRFPLKFQLPSSAPYSLDLDDNDLTWSANVNVDIPRWPDWRKTLPLCVVPSGAETSEQVIESSDGPIAGSGSSDQAVTSPPMADAGRGDITFAETAQHLYSVREDHEQTQMLVDAVTGLTFEMQARIDRRLLYSGDDDPHVYDNGYAIWAHFPDPKLPLVLYIPHDLADEFEQIGREIWTGRGTILGWDRRHERLQLKVEI